MTIVLPKYKVEISFTSSPFTGLSFTDVSTDVRLYAGLPRFRGRSDAFAQVQASTFSFTLDNATGKYTADNTGSTFFPNVDLGRAVRVTATEDNVTFYPVFYGYIDALQTVWDDVTGLMANTLVSCVDLTSQLALHSLPADDLVAIYMTNGITPADWWRLNDPAGTAFPANLVGKTKLTPVVETIDGTFTYGDTTGTPYNGSTAVAIKGGSLASPAPSTLYAWTTGFTFMAFWRAVPPVVTGTWDVMALADASFTNFAVLQVASSGLGGLATLVVNSGPISTTITDFNSEWLLDGRLHHLAAKFDPASVGGTLTLYVDGVAVFAATGLGSIGTTAMPVNYVCQLLADNTNVIQDAAAYQSALTDQQIAAIANAGLNAFAGETSVQRVNRLAGFYPGATFASVGTAGTQHMAPLRDLSRKLLDLMNDAAGVENGYLYVSPSGTLTLRTRLARYNQSPALSLGNGDYEETLAFLKDRSQLLNDVTATAFGSTNPQEVVDSVSALRYGELADQKSLETLDDTEALAYAQNRVGDGKPRMRSPKIDIDLMTQQALNPGLLAAFWQLDLGELVALTSVPTQGPASSASFLAEGIADTLTDISYDASINTSAAPIGAWKLQDAVLGLLGSTTYLAY